MFKGNIHYNFLEIKILNDKHQITNPLQEGFEFLIWDLFVFWNLLLGNIILELFLQKLRRIASAVLYYVLRGSFT